MDATSLHNHCILTVEVDTRRRFSNPATGVSATPTGLQIPTLIPRLQGLAGGLNTGLTQTPPVVGPPQE